MIANPSEQKYQLAYIDIETTPSLGWVWQKYDTNVIAFEQDWYMLSFSVRWEGQKSTEVFALPDFPLYKKDPKNDLELVKELWKVLNKADLVVAHNGDKFDIRKSNVRFIFHGFNPPAPYKTVDTLKVARKYFAFTSNSLNDLAQFLGIGEKVKTGGAGLWFACMAGNKSAWDRMKKYNKQDTVLLEKVYNRLKGWHTTHPNVAIATGKSHLCPACGSSNVQRRGWQALKSYRAQRYQCMNLGCGKWSTGNREKIKADILS